ncbi:sulfotransferase [Photobacterium sp. BZF1]|uniref:sulfotransferase family protein n=1 Tax=Photobacterium sp. BZF1 TaxID=1904457 RepID=UPI001653BE7F|nr:sulfotransferase [Photobacterium sp. BZF1]MBC7006432.1 sulfotransferase [Photobacterium sp. BZF1]
MAAVNLFIVGGQKCGTTALASFIQQHPDICLVQNKEAHVFDSAQAPEMTRSEFQACFDTLSGHYQGEKYLCDATPIYSYWPEAIESVAEYAPDAKVIFLLRDPVDRAVSQYQMEHKRGLEPKGMFQAFLAEPSRLEEARGDRTPTSPWRVHSYMDRGHFSVQYKKLMELFDKDQILVLHNNQLRNNHDATLKKVFDFLQLPDHTIPAKEVFSGEYLPMGWEERLARMYAKWKLKKEREFVAGFDRP